MANTEENEEEPWNLKFREDEEMEFFTELALHETERWIQAVTKKKFAYPDDFRKSLENGVLLCELLNNLKPGAVKRINKLPGAIAGLDNINVFLKACRASFGLNDKHLFDPNDLEDLSQRAIADSDHLLKQEEDRRAVNVAITIYWLGRSVANSYSGAQLDISAFAALVHHNGKEIIPDDHFRHDSWETSDYNSSAYSSHENNSKVSLPDGTSYEQKHNRDSSYESYGSYSRGSESLDEDNMPVRRYGSASSLNRSGEQLRFSATSDIYSDGGQDSLYQSSPDLLHGTNNHHRRSSSTDSMDGSYHGSHSRQSSDSVENYPTRTLSTQRKTSTSTADPLQFIKLKPSNDLAKKAEAQIRATEALKTERVKAEKELEHDIPDDNWQSNLSSWKNRRRRQSAATYERVEGSVDGAETKSKEQEEKKKPKTYSQIMAERDKRKSTGTLNFYPIEDDDEPSWLTDAKSSRNTKAEEPERAVEPEPVITQRSVRTEYRAPPISSRSKSLSSLKQRPSSVGSEKLSTFDIDDTAVATWAEEQSDEESDNSQKKADEEEANNTDTKPQRNNDTNQNNQEEQQQVNNRLNDKNERFSSWNRKTESSLSDKSSSVYKNDKMDSGKTTSNKVSGLLKSFEKKDEDAKVSYEKPSRSFQFSATSDSSRRSEGFRNQKSKSFDTGTAGLTFSASPVKTEKIKSPVNAKPPVNPALLRKDTSPKQEAPEVKNYIEKTIKINQKPKNSRGFGFTIAGGADRKQPLEVTKVNLGSAADVCELQVHDEIVSINRKDVKNLTYFQVNRLIEKGVEIGEIELQIQRKISEGDDIWDEDEEEDDDDDAFQSSNSSSNRFNSSADRSYSPLHQSKHRSFSPLNNTPNRSVSPLQSQNRSFSPIQSHNQSTPVERPERPERQRRDFSSPLHRKDQEIGSPKLDTPSPVQVEETKARRQSPLAFNTNIRSPHLEGHSKFAEGDTNFDKSKSDTTPDDDKMWIMDKLVNSSQPVNHNSYGQTYNQEETANISTNQDEQVEVAKPQIEVAFSQQVSPPMRQEVIEDTEVIQKSVQSNQYSEPKMELSDLPEVSQKVDIEVVERPTVVMRRKKPDPPKPQEDQLLSWEAPIRDKQPPPAPAPAEDSSGFGPPAALLRWQRPRPRSEYNFSSKSVLDSSDDFKKRLSGTWQLDKPSSEPESSKLDVQFSSEQQQFETKSKHLQQQYDDDMKKVESGHQEQFDKNVEEAITLANSQELHSSNMEQPIRFQVSSQQQSELRIDPRNHYPSEQNLPQYNFHLNLGQSGNSEDMQRETELERERQRIREEEKRHLDEEKRKWEEEEKRKLQEKEQQLKEQEEKLRQGEERLRKQQEEMERQKHELERTRIETNSPRFEQSVNARDYSRSTFNSKPQFSTSASMDSKVGPRRLDTAWPPEDKEIRAEKERQKLTREDLLAMNRKATPLQRKPETEIIENNTDSNVNKEVPVNRHHDLHSLNVVPKPRIRNSVDWINSNDKQYDNTSVRRSNSPHEHWLVEEAERRRLAESKGRPSRHSAHVPLSNYSGPIKPVSEGLSNRWRDDSNVPRQHTFDASNTGLTKPRSLYHSSQHESQQFSAKHNVTMSQTLPPNFSFDSSLGRKDAPPPMAPPVAPKPMRSSPNPHSPSSPSSPANHAEQVTAVSGRQGCSHCGQELGFGAAMVIESLGLYYHVQCFRCCVCRTALGNGSQGADVRVRVNKLHCRNCYSNDEEGLKYSKV